MKLRISSFRGSHKTQNPRQVICVSPEIETREKADELKGKKAVWTTPSGKIIEGEISGAHGNKGAMKVRFHKGLPGQALGTELDVQ